jgi:hypothetical protein
LSPEQIGEVLKLLPGADSVELTLSVPDGGRRSAVRSLAMDPLAAQIRQVMFFDTPDLALNRSGVVVRHPRRSQARDASMVASTRSATATGPSASKSNPVVGRPMAIRTRSVVTGNGPVASPTSIAR